MKAGILVSMFRFSRTLADKLLKAEQKVLDSTHAAIAEEYDRATENAHTRLAYAKDFLVREEAASKQDLANALERKVSHKNRLSR